MKRSRIVMSRFQLAHLKFITAELYDREINDLLDQPKPDDALLAHLRASRDYFRAWGYRLLRMADVMPEVTLG